MLTVSIWHSIRRDSDKKTRNKTENRKKAMIEMNEREKGVERRGRSNDKTQKKRQDYLTEEDREREREDERQNGKERWERK